MASAATLGMLGSVLRGALEVDTAANAAAASSSVTSTPSDSCRAPVIPMKGTTKSQWMQVAAFLYPVVPSPEITSWKQLELLLEVGSRYDLQLVLHKVDLYLCAKARTMSADVASEECVWSWLWKADKAGPTMCLEAVARRAVAVDRSGCGKAENQQGLSPAALKALVNALTPVPSPRNTTNVSEDDTQRPSVLPNRLRRF